MTINIQIDFNRGGKIMKKIIEYSPKGVCSIKMTLVIEDVTDTIVDFKVLGGCSGNLAGIRQLIIGMKAEDVYNKLAGTKCGNKNTSCPDQLSKALKNYIDSKID